MRYLFFTLLFLASTSSAHEERINLDQRRAIRERLQQAGCFRTLAEAGNEVVTRGGPTRRSASRGTSRSLDDVLPPDVEQFSFYFSQFIPTELDMAYGKPSDPKAHTFFRNDPHEGTEKVAVQKELGIRWEGNGAPTVSPTWIEFARNYDAAIRKRGLDPSETFVPALVLYRDIGGGKKEYKFIDPVREKFPGDMSQWKVLDKDVQFNIPAGPIFEAMKDGKFPLLDAVHDISHFVSFVRFPEFAKAVRARMKEMKPEDNTVAFRGREYWLTEALSLPDPNSQSANHAFLSRNKRPTEVRGPPAIEKDLRAMNERDLADYSYRLAKHFESQLRDVSGGNSSSAEKWYYLSEGFGMSAQEMLNEDLSKAKPLQPILGLGKIYFDNAPITLNANPKSITNETATFNFNTFVAAQKLLALSLMQNKVDAAAKEEAVQRLVQFTSRTEWLMTERPFTYQEWADGFLKADLPKEDPLAKMITTLFPNDIVGKYYIGKGETRPKKKPQ